MSGFALISYTFVKNDQVWQMSKMQKRNKINKKQLGYSLNLDDGAMLMGVTLEQTLIDLLF